MELIKPNCILNRMMEKWKWKSDKGFTVNVKGISGKDSHKTKTKQNKKKTF